MTRASSYFIGKVIKDIPFNISLALFIALSVPKRDFHTGNERNGSEGKRRSKDGEKIEGGRRADNILAVIGTRRLGGGLEGG
jgi:hypothetical protein